MQRLVSPSKFRFIELCQISMARSSLWCYVKIAKQNHVSRAKSCLSCCAMMANQGTELCHSIMSDLPKKVMFIEPL